MASNLTFTSNIFTIGTLFATASATGFYTPTTTSTAYEILGGTFSYERRLYGLSVFNTGAAQTLTVFLNDNIKNSQIFQITVAIGSTTPTVTDLFNTSNIASLFQRQRDANGVTYFNIPVGCSIKCAYSASITSSQLISFTAYGETYE